jgi:signal peptidase I
MESLRTHLFRMAVTIPPVLYFKDTFYSLYRVDGASMEPALHHGDVLLVRKADLYPHAAWTRWTSAGAAALDEEAAAERRDAVGVLAHDAQAGRPVGAWLTGRTYLHPPMVRQVGSVVVFRAPDAERHPSREYRVKRVVGLGGQLCRARGEYRRLERVPPFALWVEGDNREADGEAPSDSRTYGAVCKNSVIGIAERVVWPPSRWGAVPCITPPVPRSWWD